MPMNLMGAGIMAAPTVSPGIGRHFTFKEKIFSSITETIKKHDQLQDMGFVMHSIWSCYYLRERCMLRDVDVPLPKEKYDPINIKNSYFGGRTNAIVLHREFPPNSHGGYLDICSLYPYVLKYERYPIGHPTCFTNNFFPFFKVHCKGGCNLAISWALPCVKDGIGEYLISV